MKKALIACGGTGGHLSPGVAVAERLIELGYRCELLISKKQVDSRLVGKYEAFEYDSIPGSALSLSPIRFGKFSYNLLSGIVKCIRKIRREKPDVVIGFGGFLSMPALFAGYVCGVPVAIHEANRVPGRVTRMVSRFATRIYLPEGIEMSIRKPARIINLGMPVRSEIQKRDPIEAKRVLGLNEGFNTLLVFGGSQGAQSLTNWVAEHQSSLGKLGWQVYCLTGSQGGEDREEVVRLEEGGELKTLYRTFSDYMATVLSAADLVVSRAGAGSISEIVRCEVPAILIPYPFAADDHQQANAKRFVEQGGGVAIDQSELGQLFELVRDVVSDAERMDSFRTSLKAMGTERPQVQIGADLEGLVEAKRR